MKSEDLYLSARASTFSSALIEMKDPNQRLLGQPLQGRNPPRVFFSSRKKKKLPKLCNVYMQELVLLEVFWVRMECLKWTPVYPQKAPGMTWKTWFQWAQLGALASGFFIIEIQFSSRVLNFQDNLTHLVINCSNYDVFLTRDCLAYSKVKPAVNQIETHPYFQRDSLVNFCQKHGICVTAHTPLGGALANTKRFGSVSCLDDPLLKVIFSLCQEFFQ